LAARAIGEAFTRKDFSFKSYKPTLLHSQLGRALRRRTWFAKFFYGLHYSWFQAFAWRRLGAIIEWVMQTFMIGWASRAR
jgi:hypothetical protein